MNVKYGFFVTAFIVKNTNIKIIYENIIQKLSCEKARVML